MKRCIACNDASRSYEAYGPKSFSKRKFTTAFTWQDGSCAAWLKASTVETSRETSSQLSAVTCTNSQLWSMVSGSAATTTDRSIRAYGARSFNRPAYFLENRNSTRYRNPLHGTASSALSCTFKHNLYFSCFFSSGCFASSVIRANTIFFLSFLTKNRTSVKLIQ